MAVAGRQFLRFLVVGGIAFLLGAGLLTVLQDMGLHPLAAQVPTVLFCVCLTWLGNRSWTFETRQTASVAEFWRYLVASGVGLAINLLAFASVWAMFGNVLLAYCLATIAALVFNFTSYRLAVFTDR